MLQEGADLPGTPLSGSFTPEWSGPSPHSGSYSAAYQQRAALADPDSCKLEMFVACNRTRLLLDLMKAVDKDEVTQVCDSQGFTNVMLGQTSRLCSSGAISV